MDGHTVHILLKNEDTGNFLLDNEALSDILLRPEVKDKPVCVLAVAGAFRQGKSFLLNFLLRFCNNRDQEDWLGDPYEALTGFSWSRGSRRETTGIVAWSEPFIFESSSGEEIAVVLLDTQGTFDTQATTAESVKLFSLAMMLSSVFVYNLMQNIKEDDLMNLQTFTSIAVKSQQNCSSHIFQLLQFLVRDWQFPTETPYGNGQVVLDKKLEDVPTMDQSHKDVRRYLKRCFKAINCYLMPNPGSSITKMANFDGKVADLDNDFVEHLRELVPSLLAPDNLVKKDIGGKEINGSDLFKLFKDFTEAVTSNDLSTSLFQCTSRTSSQVALRAGKELYKEAMNLLVTGVGIFLSKQEMDSKHTNEKNRAVQLYLDENKYGSIYEIILKEYQEKLIDEIEELFTKFSELMEAKNKTQKICEVALCEHISSYNKTMESLVGPFTLYVDPTDMDNTHANEKRTAMESYLTNNKSDWTNASIVEQYKVKLGQEIDKQFHEFANRINSMHARRLKLAAGTTVAAVASVGAVVAGAGAVVAGAASTPVAATTASELLTAAVTVISKLAGY